MLNQLGAHHERSRASDHPGEVFGSRRPSGEVAVKLSGQANGNRHQGGGDDAEREGDECANRAREKSFQGQCDGCESDALKQVSILVNCNHGLPLAHGLG